MMAFTLVEITGNFEIPNGKIGTGKVTATLSTPIQNGEHTLQTQPIKAVITNGKVTFSLYANNDPETLPINSYYTFLVEPYLTESYTFKTIVPHTAVGRKTTLAALYEASGKIGVPSEVRPKLNSHSTTQMIGEALAALGLVEFTNEHTGEIP